jgi:hypothetical protein
MVMPAIALSARNKIIFLLGEKEGCLGMYINNSQKYVL